MKKMLMVFAAILMTLGAQCEVKVLDWSWSNPSIEFLEEYLADMNREARLIDGLFVRFSGNKLIGADGKKWSPGSANAWNRRTWKLEYFKDFITHYNKLDKGRFTDNFLVLTTMIVVTVNATREPVRAHFAFKGIGEVKVKFKNRIAKADSDGWQDDYQPLERHVYEITLK